MPTYLFYQKTGGQNQWECALATERDALFNGGEVEFVTALDVDNSFTQALTLEESIAVKYSAPYGFYVDFDGDLDEVLGQAKVYLLKLEQAYGLDISQARLWFTGGRGCHVEIPMQCWLAKVPPSGIAGLPLVFREIALATYVDTLDLRVYSTKRGRMWRTPNYKRKNGLYKVQVTVDEFMDATPETYVTICSKPRRPIPTTPPTFNPKLGLAYTLAKEKVDAALKKRKARKVSASTVTRYEGQWPDSVRLLMTGEFLKEGVGWNQIALQLASLALALGKTEDELVADSNGLIDTHQGDSDRYGNPRKREIELRNQYRYQDGNVTYEYSVGGVKSLFAKGAYCADLDMGEYTPDEDEDQDEGEGKGDSDGDDGDLDPTKDSLPPSDEAVDEDEAPSKVVFSKKGIFAATDDGYKVACPLGLFHPVALVDKDDKPVGYEVEVFLKSKSIGTFYITLSALRTKSTFNDWINTFSTWQNLTDLQVGHLAHELRERTSKRKSKMILTSREGLDVVIPPGAKSVHDIDIIYASPEACFTLDSDREYRFRGQHEAGGSFKSDLMSAKDLEDTPETREFFDRLFRINTKANVGMTVGWFVAAFQCQIVRFHWKAFPLLQVWGVAGAGKSQTVELLSHMHYNMVHPKKISSAGNTFFPMMAAVTQSASVPVIFEEMKPRQMAKYQLDQLQNLFRTNYTGEAIERGGVNRDTAGGGTIINSYNNVAPVMFLGEALESQSAIMERCVSVSLTKEDRAGRSDDFEYCYERRIGGPLASLGKDLAMISLASKVDEVRERVSTYRNMFKERVGRKAFEDQNRPYHNVAVTLTGLYLLKYAMGRKFGTRYDETLDEIMEAVADYALNNTRRVMSEVAKVLDVMGQLTRIQNDEYKIVKGVDYITDGTTMELKLRPAYARYVRYQRGLGMEVLFDTDRAFQAAMERYSGTLATLVDASSPLYRNPFEPVFKISVTTMADEGCEPFEM